MKFVISAWVIPGVQSRYSTDPDMIPIGWATSVPGGKGIAVGSGPGDGTKSLAEQPAIAGVAVIVGKELVVAVGKRVAVAVGEGITDGLGDVPLAIEGVAPHATIKSMITIIPNTPQRRLP